MDSSIEASRKTALSILKNFICVQTKTGNINKIDCAIK